MAGVASDMLLTIREGGVDGFHHGDHPASHQLLGIRIAVFAGSGVVTVIAIHHAQRNLKCPHCGNQVSVVGENLQIDVRRLGAPALRGLGEEGETTQCNCCSEEQRNECTHMGHILSRLDRVG